MSTDQKRPMSEDQLEYVKNEIKKTYQYLISHTTYDPEVIEVMKLPWLMRNGGMRRENPGSGIRGKFYLSLALKISLRILGRSHG